MADMDRIKSIERKIIKANKRRRLMKVVGCLAAVVVFATTYEMILPALTLENKTICGMREHEHTGSCYAEDTEFSCGLEESEEHQHDSSCYTTVQVLICDIDAHTHSAACYANEVEEAKEETAADNTTENVNIPENEDDPGESAEGDVEDADLKQSDDERQEGETKNTEAETTEPDENENTDEDLSDYTIGGDAEADVETKTDWEATISGVELTGVWADDIITIAESQLGYRESIRNYIVNAEGNRKGYSRYGAWYGIPYGDWCAMYVSFCIKYAGIDAELMPLDACCQNWINTLSQEKYNYYTDEEEYIPQKGDLIFFDWSGDGHAQHVGLVVETQTDKDGTVRVKTIEGNSGDQVRYNTYPLGYQKIKGYAVLPENPDLQDEETKEEEPETKQTFTYEDDDIAVIAETDRADAMPANAELKVTAIDSETTGYNYDAYMEALNSIPDESITYEADNSVLYDVAFWVDKVDEEGNGIEGEKTEYQPSDGAVRISFRFKNNQLSDIASANGVRLIHLPLTEDVREQVDTTAEATDITAENIQIEELEAEITNECLVEFEMTDFSLVAFVTDENGNTVAEDCTTPGTNVSYQDVLGEAVNYGITANIVQKEAHMDSNFATKELYLKNGDSNVTAGKYTNDGRGGQFLIGAVTSPSGNNRIAIDGKGFLVRTTTTASQKIRLQDGSSYFVYDSQSNVNGDVTDMIAYATAISNQMYQERTYKSYRYYEYYWTQKEDGTWGNVPGYYSDQNDKILDISDLPSGTYYIDGDEFMAKNDMKIIKNSDQTIVFNFDATTAELHRYSVVIKDIDPNKVISSATSNESSEDLASTLIFNLPNATTVTVSEVNGIIIAPKAAVVVNATSMGWVVCDTLRNPGGEWHCVYQEMPDRASIRVTAKKTVDDTTPTTDEEFTFRLETWNGNAWTDSVTTQNKRSDVLFDKTYTAAGTYYYRLSEVANSGPDGINYDKTSYIIKVVVTQKTTSTGAAAFTAAKTYYKTDAVSKIGESNLTSGLVFNNTSGSVVPEGFTLPDTGGAGTLYLSLIGLLFAVGGLTVFGRRHKKERRRI